MTGNPSRGDDDRVLREALAATLEGVGKDTGLAIDALRARAKANRRAARMAMMAAIIALVAIVGLVLLGLRVQHNANNIGLIQDRTNTEVLCPLYGAFLAARDNPVPDNIKNDPKQLAEREKAFKTIEKGADVLGCFKNGMAP